MDGYRNYNFFSILFECFLENLVVCISIKLSMTILKIVTQKKICLPSYPVPTKALNSQVIIEK
jgi:hypothetical protein